MIAPTPKNFPSLPLRLVALLALAAASCGDKTAPPPGQAHHAAGVVIWVNADAGSIKIDHEEIKDLMPAMAMKFGFTVHV